jgi:hypothetical protein
MRLSKYKKCLTILCCAVLLACLVAVSVKLHSTRSNRQYMDKLSGHGVQSKCYSTTLAESIVSACLGKKFEPVKEIQIDNIDALPEDFWNHVENMDALRHLILDGGDATVNPIAGVPSGIEVISFSNMKGISASQVISICSDVQALQSIIVRDCGWQSSDAEQVRVALPRVELLFRDPMAVK